MTIRKTKGNTVGRKKPALDATAAILAQRGATHGDFTDNADTAQMMKAIARASCGWKSLTNVQREAIDMNISKLARILTGNPNEPDHWRDIQGYARLAEDRCDTSVS